VSDVQERQRTSEGGAGEGGSGGDLDLEGMARRAGWVPEEDWTGKAGKWVPADKYLDRVLSTNPERLAERYKSLDTKFAALAQQNEKTQKTLEDAVDVLNQFREYNAKVAERAYQRAKTELEAKFERAVDEGDKKVAKEATEELKKLEEEKPVAPPPEDKKPAAAAAKKDDTPPVDPEVEKWVKDNASWYNPGGTDVPTTFAVTRYSELRAKPENADKTNKELLAAVRERAIELFSDDYPEKFESVKRKPRAAAVGESGLNGGADDDDSPPAPSGGKRAAPRPKGQRFEDLPKEAQEECKRFEKQKVGENPDKSPKYLLTRDQYLADYFGEAQ
jgi:hypothetical protein